MKKRIMGLILLGLIVINSIPVLAQGKVKLGDVVQLGRNDYYDMYKEKEVNLPIMWEVVNIEDDIATLMSIYITRSVHFFPFEGYNFPVGIYKWHDSPHKKELNTTFYDKAFTDEEKEYMVEYIKGDGDKLYIPSFEELGVVDVYSKAIGFPKGSAPTKYPGKKFQNPNIRTLGIADKPEHSRSGSSFAVRNIESSDDIVPFVSKDMNGEIRFVGRLASIGNMPERPVIKVKINSDLFKSEVISKVEDGKKRKVYRLDQNEIGISINGEKLNLNSTTGKARVVDEKTIIPLRVISEGLGWDVSWDKASNKTIITSGDIKLEIKEGSKIACLNGRQVSLERQIKSYDGRMYVPLRFFGESMGVTVDYSNRSITINSRI